MEQDQPDWIAWAQSYKSGMLEAHRLVSLHRNSDSTRLVWYVAVCGYVLLNGPDFVDRFLPDLKPGQMAVLIIPWSLAAILSVAGHIAVVHAATREDRYYLGVYGAVDVFTFHVASGKTDGSALLAIINDSHPKLGPARIDMDAANKRRRTVILAAQWTLLGNFAWSTIALVFSRCLFS